MTPATAEKTRHPLDWLGSKPEMLPWLCGTLLAWLAGLFLTLVLAGGLPAVFSPKPLLITDHYLGAWAAKLAVYLYATPGLGIWWLIWSLLLAGLMMLKVHRPASWLALACGSLWLVLASGAVFSLVWSHMHLGGIGGAAIALGLIHQGGAILAWALPCLIAGGGLAATVWAAWPVLGPYLEPDPESASTPEEVAEAPVREETGLEAEPESAEDEDQAAPSADEEPDEEPDIETPGDPLIQRITAFIKEKLPKPGPKPFPSIPETGPEFGLDHDPAVDFMITPPSGMEPSIDINPRPGPGGQPPPPPIPSSNPPAEKKPQPPVPQPPKPETPAAEPEGPVIRPRLEGPADLSNEEMPPKRWRTPNSPCRAFRSCRRSNTSAGRITRI